MKNRKFIVATASFAASLCLSPAFAQEGVDAGAELDAAAELQAKLAGEAHLSPIFRATDVLLERALGQIEELPAEVQAEVTALQESVAALRAEWETNYKPAVGATIEEVIAAREQFRADMAAEIAATKELRKDIVAQLRRNIREEAEGELDSDTSVQFKQYQALGLQIGAAWREARAELGPDATEEEIQVAKQAFLEANAELIAERRTLAIELRASGEARASVDRPAIERDAVPEAVQRLKEEMQVARAELKEQRKQIREELAGLSEEEREVRRQELVEQLRTTNEELKERRRSLIDELRNDQTGDRRAED